MGCDAKIYGNENQIELTSAHVAAYCSLHGLGLNLNQFIKSSDEGQFITIKAEKSHRVKDLIVIGTEAFLPLTIIQIIPS
jgi:hypothetical protein